jgi:hypothetical protein
MSNFFYFVESLKNVLVRLRAAKTHSHAATKNNHFAHLIQK